MLVRFLRVTVRKKIIRVEKVLLISGLRAQKALDDLQCSVYHSLISPSSSEMGMFGNFSNYLGGFWAMYLII